LKWGNALIILDRVGSGVVLTSIAQLVQKWDKSIRFVGTDINPIAIKTATETAAKNNILNASFIETEFLRGVEEKANIIIFNPVNLIELILPSLMWLLLKMNWLKLKKNVVSLPHGQAE